MSTPAPGVEIKTSGNGNTSVSLVDENKSSSGIQLFNPYRTKKVSSGDLVSLAQEIQKADVCVQANVCNKLQVIAEQVRFLQEQARKILQDAKESYDLHHVPCNFVKKLGHIYYLYRRPSGQRYFSLISPKEWGASCPHDYQGTFRLEHDQSWTPEDKFEQREGDEQLIRKILKNTNMPSIAIN